MLLSAYLGQTHVLSSYKMLTQHWRFVSEVMPIVDILAGPLDGGSQSRPEKQLHA